VPGETLKRSKHRGLLLQAACCVGVCCCARQGAADRAVDSWSWCIIWLQIACQGLLPLAGVVDRGQLLCSAASMSLFGQGAFEDVASLGVSKLRVKPLWEGGQGVDGDGRPWCCRAYGLLTAAMALLPRHLAVNDRST
jgi:hypothetical protein